MNPHRNAATLEKILEKNPIKMEMSHQESDYKQTRIVAICLCITFVALVTGVTTCNTRKETIELETLKDHNMTCPCVTTVDSGK